MTAAKKPKAKAAKMRAVTVWALIEVRSGIVAWAELRHTRAEARELCDRHDGYRIARVRLVEITKRKPK